jgi:hypothetical protein
LEFTENLGFTGEMSVTTTDNARVTTVRHLLADYELHHSQPPEEEQRSAPEPNLLDNPTSTNNPPDWQRDWRRVPPYRPVQNQVDDQRDVYNNEIEHTFIRVMFGGVWMMAVSLFKAV